MSSELRLMIIAPLKVIPGSITSQDSLEAISSFDEVHSSFMDNDTRRSTHTYFLINFNLYLILSPSLNLRPMASLMERHFPSDTISSSDVRREATSLP